MSKLVVSCKVAVETIEKQLISGQKLLIKSEYINDEISFEILIEEYHEWWKETSGILVELFDDNQISEEFKDCVIVRSEEQVFDIIKKDYIDEINNHIKKLKLIIERISEETESKPKIDYVNKTKIYFRSKWYFAIPIMFISTILLINAFMKSVVEIPESYGKMKESLSKTEGKDDKVSKKGSDVKELVDDPLFLVNKKLPYLEKVPIIDNFIYIQFNFTNLVFSGMDVEKIRIGARGKNGELVKVRRYKRKIEIYIYKQPYIEFFYKDVYYSMSITGKVQTYYCTMKKNIKTTLKLTSFGEI